MATRNRKKEPKRIAASDIDRKRRVSEAPDVLFDPAAQVATLRKAIEDSPKSTRWRMRARVGDRVKWYDEPEEMGHGPL